MSQYPFLDAELLRVREQLNTGVPGREFDMREYHNGCGTVGCIAGWIYFNNKEEFDANHIRSIEHLMMLYGVPKDVAYDLHNGPNRLFFMFDSEHSLGEVTEGDAIKAIDNFIATGEPLWEEVLEDA
jgi:hypothetical protein